MLVPIAARHIGADTSLGGAGLGGATVTRDGVDGSTRMCLAAKLALGVEARSSDG